VSPVGRRLDASPLDGDEVALDAEQSLDNALGLLVASLAEVAVAEDALSIDEIERRPVVLAEDAPDPVAVIDHDRVVDLALLDRLAYVFGLVPEGELRRVHADHDESVSVGGGPSADVGFLAQPVDAGQRPEVDKNDVTAQPGGAGVARS
jgi:hypothetical protein